MRIAILNGISGNPKMPFMGLRIQGIPRLTLVREDSLAILERETSPVDDNLFTAVELSEHPALIPDLEALELLVAAHIKDDTVNA